MARSAKTPKFDAFNSFSNCFGPRQTHTGSWKDYLDGVGDLVIELGAGKADFTLGYSKAYPDKRIVAVDLKSDRLYSGAKQAKEDKQNNIAFLQLHAENLTDEFENISEIWLTFPDPYPKDRQEKHRMTGQRFLKIYYETLKANGFLHLKTDNQALFEWSKDQIQSSDCFDLQFATNDLHAEGNYEDAKILTRYEERFLALNYKTHYLFAKSV